MYSVMIVDDLEIIRLQLKRLKVWGENSAFKITDEARNGREALDKLETSKVDLIITDIRMPILGGVELLEEIMTKKLAHCVVLLSEYSEFEYARKGLILGAFDYIVKPINENELAKLLQRVKAFITEKEYEEKRLQRYNPSKDIEQILELVLSGKSPEKLIYSIFHRLTVEEEDVVKIDLSIQRLFKEILEAINREMSWLKKFIDINYYEWNEISNIDRSEKVKHILITHIINQCNHINTIYFGSDYGRLINQISTLVLENVDCEINLSIIANQLFLNKNYLSDVFKRKTQISLLDYITKIKIERAKLLLVEGELKNYEIADKIGYKDPEYFSRIFKRYTDLSPTDYKNLQNQKISDKAEIFKGK